MKTLVVSPSSLNTYASCARKFNYEKNLRLALAVTPSRFDKGTLIHYMLEEWYKGKLNGAPRTTAEDIIALAYQRALDLDLLAEEVGNVIKTFKNYIIHYGGEAWEALAVEAAFSKILYEDEELRILFEGKVDLLVKTNTTFVVDHKSSERFMQPNFLSNQGMGYCWAFGVNNIVYNRMKIPAEDKDDFSRPTISYNNDQLAEWQHQAIYWALSMHGSLEAEAYAPNYTSCDKFGKCAFQRLCNAKESHRAEIMLREYKVRPEHDLFAEVV